MHLRTFIAVSSWTCFLSSNGNAKEKNYYTRDLGPTENDATHCDIVFLHKVIHVLKQDVPNLPIVRPTCCTCM